MQTTLRNTKSLAVGSASHLEIEVASAMAAKSQKSPIRSADELSTPEIPESVLRLVRAEVKELSGLLEQLSELRQAEPTDDYGILRLDEAAFERARELLTDATIVLASTYQAKMPYGCASTDSEGGLCIDWLRSDRAVNLVIPASHQKPAYFYHELGPDHAMEYEVTPERLATWLRIIND